MSGPRWTPPSRSTGSGYARPTPLHLESSTPARLSSCFRRETHPHARQAAKVEADRKAAGKRRARKKSDEERAAEAAERDEAVAGRAEQLTQRYMKEGEAAARAAEGPEARWEGGTGFEPSGRSRWLGPGRPPVRVGLPAS